VPIARLSTDQVAYKPMDGQIGRLDRLVDYEHSLTMDLIDAGPASYYSHILAESVPEKLMIEGLRDRKGMVFMKLPDSFRIPTPVGGYVPDLGIVKDAGDGARLYLVREVKGMTGTASTTPRSRPSGKSAAPSATSRPSGPAATTGSPPTPIRCGSARTWPLRGAPPPQSFGQ
ncbi:MAG: hypothetical protein KDJ81_06945, partial [Rhodobacteraceae bacterium]|nr:hypothetical protein [Paracoccaceae bacterium]